MIVSSKVPSNMGTLTVLDYLSQRFTYLSKESWEKRFLEKRLSVNGKICSKDLLVSNNDIVSYDLPDFKEPPADLNYRIIYEDDDLLAVDKPGNLLVHHSGKSLKSNLIYQLKNIHNPKYPNADIINRLDRETSGLVLVSKNKKVLKEMHKIFEQKKITKKYIALVYGTPTIKIGTIKAPLAKDKESVIRYKHKVDFNFGKISITEYSLLKTIGNKYSLLSLIPITGRTHQIRVHLSYIGHGIVGDKLYGLTDIEYKNWLSDHTLYKEKLLHNRQALHCCEVEFFHPILQKNIQIKSDLPDDIHKLESKLANQNY